MDSPVSGVVGEIVMQNMEKQVACWASKVGRLDYSCE